MQNFLLDTSLRDNVAQEVNCRQSVKNRQKNTLGANCIRDNSIFHSTGFLIFLLMQLHLEPLDRRTIHAAGILQCNMHACKSTLTDVHNTSTRRVEQRRRCEFHLTSSQLWRAVFPAGTRNRESYSRTMKPLFLAKASSDEMGDRAREERRKIERREEHNEWSGRDGRDGGRERKRERKRKREI